MTAASGRIWTIGNVPSFSSSKTSSVLPFDVFHEAVGQALGRPVYTHEFGLNREGLQQELMGDAPPPTLQDLLDLLPEGAQTVIVGAS